MTDDLRSSTRPAYSPRAPEGHPGAQRAAHDVLWADELLSIRESLIHELSARRIDYQNTLISLDRSVIDRHSRTGENSVRTGRRAAESNSPWDLAATRREAITHLEHALEHIDSGSYGWCQGCQSLLCAARLEAYPAATLCVACKAYARYL